MAGLFDPVDPPGVATGSCREITSSLGSGGPDTHRTLPLERKAAVLTRFWQAVPQNLRVPLRETST